MDNREGPKKNVFTMYRYSCEGCKYLSLTIIKGFQVTDCMHPKWDSALPGLRGRSLGGDTDTPNWCPVLKDGE